MQELNVGIGIITCRRQHTLNNLVDSIYANTSPEHEVIIFDDSGREYSSPTNANRYTHFITEVNNGVAFNKNRALYYFSKIRKKDVILLIEDDCLITKSDWVEVWARATHEYGHINYEPIWFKNSNYADALYVARKSPTQPSIYSLVTGQVSGIRVDALLNSRGFLNPNFIGFGYEHVEWTNRFVDLGFGGVNAGGIRFYFALGYGIEIQKTDSNMTEIAFKENSSVFETLGGKGGPVREPWKDLSAKEDFETFIKIG